MTRTAHIRPDPRTPISGSITYYVETSADWTLIERREPHKAR